METALSLIPGLVVALFVAFTVLRAVRIVPRRVPATSNGSAATTARCSPASISSSPTSTGSIR